MELTCPACRQAQLHQPATCPNCHYPFDGSPAEQARHIRKYLASGGTSHQGADPLKLPRLILYAMALLSAGFHLYNYFGGGFSLGALILNIGLVATYAVCAGNLPRNPLLFAAAPLVLFVLINALDFIVDPTVVYHYLWLKVGVASCLLIALRLAVVAQQARGEFGME